MLKIDQMIIKSANYIASYPNFKLCPKADRPEYAFIGRSNVGKSSLINMLCNQRGLARTSGKPGKTQSINYFDINEEWYLVDLPGYGYAHTPKNIRQNWRKMIEDYMTNRLSMQCAFLLIDSAVPPQEADLEFADWMGANQIPFALVFTKTDRKKAKKNSDYLEQFQKEFMKNWESFPPYFISSANTQAGREDILAFIEDINLRFSEQEL